LRNFLDDHVEPGVFDPDAVDILVAAFDAAWQSIKTVGVNVSDKQIELMRATLASTSLNRLGTGERDHCRLRDGALLHLAQSNLRYTPPERK
jgi:hypothetical protein